MGDHIIDTNVLLVASMEDPGSPFMDSQHVPANEREYKKNLSKEDLGRKVVVEKLQSAIRYVTVQAEHHGSAVVAAVHDPSDRKFVATALADEGNSSIVNACDTDWYDWESALSKASIVVDQLLDGWCRKLHRQKRQRK